MSDRSEDVVLADILSTCQLQARIVDNPTLCGNWREWEEPAPPGTAWFHLVDSGACWIESTSLASRVRLEAGDLIVFPQGSEHWLVSDPDGQESFSVLLCGEFALQRGNLSVLEALPKALIVRASEAGAAMRAVCELMVEESRSGRFGNQAVLDKLADVLFVMSLRHHLSTGSERRGVLAALSDPKLARALRAMHGDLARNWSVSALAEESCLSRTAFAERFSTLMGEGPIQFLTGLRMNEALRLLRDPKLSVASVAGQLGYQTEAAFRRSFQRFHGFGPGRLRRSPVAIQPAA